MIKNVLVISSSWRKSRNSDTLADEFVKGSPALVEAYGMGKNV